MQTRLEFWSNDAGEWRWSLYAGAGRDERKVAVSPTSYLSAADARADFLRVLDVMRFNNPHEHGRERGSVVVELLVALALGLIVAGALVLFAQGAAGAAL